METIYQFGNVQVKVIDNSSQEEKRKRLEQALIRFANEVEREKKIKSKNRKDVNDC